MKAWGGANFARLGRLLRERHGAGLVLTGGPDDVPLAVGIALQMDSPSALHVGHAPADAPPAGSATQIGIAPPPVLAGRTSVREMAAVIERLDVLVSVDSGPAHMAAALGTPLVVLWGPAILHQVCPQGDASKIRVVRQRTYLRALLRHTHDEDVRPQHLYGSDLAGTRGARSSGFAGYSAFFTLVTFKTSGDFSANVPSTTTLRRAACASPRKRPR